MRRFFSGLLVCLSCLAHPALAAGDWNGAGWYVMGPAGEGAGPFEQYADCRKVSDAENHAHPGDRYDCSFVSKNSDSEKNDPDSIEAKG